MLFSIALISALINVFNPVESINVRKTFHGLSSISDPDNYKVKWYQQKVGKYFSLVKILLLKFLYLIPGGSF